MSCSSYPSHSTRSDETPSGCATRRISPSASDRDHTSGDAGTGEQFTPPRAAGTNLGTGGDASSGVGDNLAAGMGQRQVWPAVAGWRPADPQ